MTSDSEGAPPLDEAAIKRRRAIAVVAAFVVLGIVGWNFRPRISIDLGSAHKPLVGCYRSGTTMVRLSDQGFLDTVNGKWSYTVEGDKDARVLVVDEITASPDGSGVKFSRAPRGKGIRVSVDRRRGFNLDAAHFAKVPCGGMEHRSA